VAHSETSRELHKMEIKGLSLSQQLEMLKGVSSPQTPEKTSKVSFGDFLEKKFDELNQIGLDVDKKIQATAEGKSENPHETIIAIQKADVTFKLMLSVKDQLEQAYQQIMRTSIG
jgi:flagellar hook-basal body complex protein FliE